MGTVDDGVIGTTIQQQLEAAHRAVLRSQVHGGPPSPLAYMAPEIELSGGIALLGVAPESLKGCGKVTSLICRYSLVEGLRRRPASRFARANGQAGRSTLAPPAQRSPRLKVIASNGRMLTGSSSFALAISNHCPSRSSNASRVRSIGSTSHR